MNFLMIMGAPQGLKPKNVCGCYGTAEAVPLQSEMLLVLVGGAVELGHLCAFA